MCWPQAGCGGRLPDVLFLDLALEGGARTALEGAMGSLRAEAARVTAAAAAAVASKGGSSSGANGGAAAAVDKLAAGSDGGGVAGGDTSDDGVESGLAVLLGLGCCALAGAALSLSPNDDLVASLKWLYRLTPQPPSHTHQPPPTTSNHGGNNHNHPRPQVSSGEASPSDSAAQPNHPTPQSTVAQSDLLPVHERAMQALAAVERAKRGVGDAAGLLVAGLQPAAAVLGPRLGLDPGQSLVVKALSEEVVRGTAAAPLAQVGCPNCTPSAHLHTD